MLGSFEEWAETVGSVLKFAGIEGFLSNLKQTQEVQDDETLQWNAFFGCWWERFGTQGVSVESLSQQILAHGAIDDDAIPDVISLNRDRGEGALRRSLGRQLAKLNGRIFSGHKLQSLGEDKHRHVRLWQLEYADKSEKEAADGR